MTEKLNEQQKKALLSKFFNSILNKQLLKINSTNNAQLNTTMEPYNPDVPMEEIFGPGGNNNNQGGFMAAVKRFTGPWGGGNFRTLQGEPRDQRGRLIKTGRAPAPRRPHNPAEARARKQAAKQRYGSSHPLARIKSLLAAAGYASQRPHTYYVGRNGQLVGKGQGDPHTTTATRVSWRKVLGDFFAMHGAGNKFALYRGGGGYGSRKEQKRAVSRRAGFNFQWGYKPKTRVKGEPRGRAGKGGRGWIPPQYKKVKREPFSPFLFRPNNN